MNLQANLNTVQARIGAACERAGRDPAGVTLVAVTKTVAAPVIQQLVELGVTHLGENRQQSSFERLPGVPALVGRFTGLARDNLTLHFIGPLQRNKVKRVVEVFDVIHGVDSVELAREISRRATRAITVFVEVNVAGEAQKHGFSPDQVASAITEIAALPGLRLAGLMCMAPYADDPETARPHFKALAELSAALRKAEPGLGPGLSMGMSGDFEVAIECGATHVRIGSALFA